MILQVCFYDRHLSDVLVPGHASAEHPQISHRVEDREENSSFVPHRAQHGQLRWSVCFLYSTRQDIFQNVLTV